MRKNIKNLIHFKAKTKDNFINSVYTNDRRKITSDSSEIANQFNNHFTTVAAKIEKKIVKTNKTYYDFLTNPMEKTFSLYPTNPTEVEDHIKNLNVRKSVGPYSIPNQILKEFNSLLSIPISSIFNVS